MIWFSGWLGTPKLTYVATVWTVFTTQQALIYGNIAYKFNKHFQVAIGVGPNLSVRSMQELFHFIPLQTEQWVKSHFAEDSQTACG